MSRGNFNAGPQGPPGLSTGPAGGDLGGTYPNPTLLETANVDAVVRASTLAQLAPPITNVNLNNNKIVNLANGTVATDAAAFGQIPTALPPNGAATGDLTGTYPAPTLANTANVQAVVRANRLEQMAAPLAPVSINNQKITNLAGGTASSDAATFGQIPNTLPPSGTASGDLGGTYPAPTLANTANVQSVVRSNRLDQMASPTNPVSMNSQKVTNLANGTVSTDAVNLSQVPTTLPPSGTASGDLSGSYPAPTVAKVNGTTVSGTPGLGKTLVASSGSAAAWGIPNWTAGSTGVLSGGNMTVHPTIPNAFNLSATTGFIADYTTNPSAPTVTVVNIPAQTITITGADAARAVNWWVADSSGTVSSIGSIKPTDAQRRTMIQLGATGGQIPSGNLITCAPAPAVLNQPYNQLLDLITNLGPFTVSGNHISANGATLSFSRSAGQAFFANFNAAFNVNDPHILVTSDLAPVPFRYSTRVSGSENGSFVTVLDPTRYDNGGVISTVTGGSNAATIQRVYLFGLSDTTAQIVVYYGQTIYSSLAAAQSAIGTTGFQENPDLEDIGILLGWIVVIRTATDLSNPAQAVFINAGKFATP